MAKNKVSTPAEVKEEPTIGEVFGTSEPQLNQEAAPTKRQRSCKITEEEGKLTMDFGDAGIVAASLTDFNLEISNKLIIFGLKNKLLDSIAKVKGGTSDDKFEVVRRLLETLKNGDWGVHREGGTREATSTLLVRAIVELSNGKKDAYAVKVALADKSKEEIAALKKVPAVAVKMAELRAASSKTGDSVLSDVLA